MSQSAQTTAPLHYFLILIRSSCELFKNTWSLIYRTWNTNGTIRIKQRVWDKGPNH